MQNEKDNLFKIDYPLQWKKKMFSLKAHYQILDIGFNLKDKGSALSDHQPILATISVKSSQKMYSAALFKFVKSLSGISISADDLFQTT